MQIQKKEWPLLSLCGIQNRIDTRPDYQRPAVWSLSQKQLLVDTILRGYDVPKLYWRQTQRGPDKYEVVDGQQRIRAIWEFHSGKYGLPKKADPIDGIDVQNLHYEDLPDDLRLRFDTYNVNVVILSETDEEEVREMFLRLQNGTSLKAQEKRNAMSGKMRDFIKVLASHPIFENCGFSDARYTFDQIAAQMTLTELVGGPTNVKNTDLNKMYEREAHFDSSGPKAKKIKRTLDYLRVASRKRLQSWSDIVFSHFMFSYPIFLNGTLCRNCISDLLAGLLNSKVFGAISANYRSINAIPKLLSTMRRRAIALTVKIVFSGGTIIF